VSLSELAHNWRTPLNLRRLSAESRLSEPTLFLERKPDGYRIELIDRSGK